LAFTRVSTYGAEHLYLVPVAGGEPRRITFENRVIHGLTWTADSREIVFSSNRAGSFSLWRIPATGGAPEQVAAAGANAFFPSISARGDRLVYTQEYDDANIWRIEVYGSTGKGGAPIRFIASARNDTMPQFSPNGKRLVFASDQFGSPELWVCDSDGSNISRLTYFNGPHVADPRWAPDSRQIAFDSTAEGSRDIYVISAGGGAPRRLTTESSTDSRASWSSDGRRIYFGSNRSGDWQMWKMPAEGGQASQVTKHGGREASESPDGKLLYYSKGYDSPGIWRMSLAGGE
jgi:Tol biopolymer transport system component